MRRYYSIVAVLIGLLIIYRIGTAIYIYEAYGALRITSSDSAATIAVGQSGKHYSIIGTGHASVRLAPGAYEVVVTNNRLQKTAFIKISRHKIAEQRIELQTTAEKQAVKNYEEANNLIKYLPYTGRTGDYRVSYAYQTSTDMARPIIIITLANQGAKSQALDWIKSLGFDPNHLQISYQAGNPLAQ